MTWAVVARKEFADAVRSKMLWGIVALIAVVTSLASVVFLLVPGFESDALVALGASTQFASLLVPILALIAAYLAIAGERESGSLKVLLGFPPSRGEVVLGKFLGRSGVVAIGLTAGFLVSGVVTFLVYGDLPLVEFLLATGLTVLLGLAFVGVAIGISAATSTRSRAMTIAVGTYLVLSVLWDLVPNGVHVLVTGEMAGAVVPPWYVLVQALSPSGAYTVLNQAILTGGSALTARIGGPLPFYLESWFVVAILLAWVLVPTLFGYLRFRRADLS